MPLEQRSHLFLGNPLQCIENVHWKLFDGRRQEKGGGKKARREGEKEERREGRRDREGKIGWLLIFPLWLLLLFLIFFFPYYKPVFSSCTNSSGWLRETLSIILCNYYFLLFVWLPNSVSKKRGASLSEAGCGGRECVCRVSCVKIASCCEQWVNPHRDQPWDGSKSQGDGPWSSLVSRDQT